MPVPPRFPTSLAFAADLLEMTGIVVVPGTGFGAAGEGFVRVSLTVPEERLREAGRRMEKAGIRFA
jgi:LL-diaminopimelate aminotransferase